ncbi:ParB N-terminal domain-containing protein [Streptomyces fildesensis]|uniref:ParB N-terminal domain-containing protein n=1 Tax=Streptomyces fildesensis TaxID=375757 RepID=UPI0018DF435E|nr:ParB N-terminal domain-containing protein [Streptomyces fildesensis]
MTTVAAQPTVWPTLPIDRLTAHPGNILPEPDADLTANIAEHGVTDPLYVVTTSTGAPQVMDGLQRLAAAQAAGLTEVPVTYRPMIRLTELTPHPDNPRESLDLSAEFVGTFAAEGCRIPIKFRILPDGTRQIVDGHRRYYAAEAAGLTHAPYEHDERDDAGTYLDMVITARHRTALSEREQANALFGAAEAGAGVKRMATAAGTTQKAIKTAMRALNSEAARKAEAAAGSLDLVTMAAIADMEARDAEAAEKITAKLTADPTADAGWLIRRAGIELDARDKLAAQRAELQAKSARMLAEVELSPKASSLYYIVGDTSQHAAQCQGAVWVLKDGAGAYVEYCANAEFFGHQVRDIDGQLSKPKPDGAERRRIIAGNLDWATAEQVRREWIAALITRRSLSRTTADQMTQTAARALLTPSTNLASRIDGDRAKAHLPKVLGMPDGTTRAEVLERWTQPKDAPRVAFAAIAAVYEGYVDRSAWRESTSHVNANRDASAQWLTWLTILGYEPSAIETAVRDRQDYQPTAEQPQAESLS